MDTNNINSEQQRQQLRNKCHGNRRDQRFRKKRRARGIKPEKIEKQLVRQRQIWNKNNSTKDKNVNNTSHATTSVPLSTHLLNQTTTTTTTTTNGNFNKRKRDSSLYELSTNQAIDKPSLSTTTTTIPSSISSTQPPLKKTKTEKRKILIEPSMMVINHALMNTNYRSVLVVLILQQIDLDVLFVFDFIDGHCT